MNNSANYHPGLSVDCVIFGFHKNELKVLLLKMKTLQEWAIPGGFVEKEEHVDDAALRILRERTGLNDIYLSQFHLFGEMNRSNAAHINKLVRNDVIPPVLEDWFRQRFVTVGYYALVEFSKTTPTPDFTAEKCEWIPIYTLPDLILDHHLIIKKGLEALRSKLRTRPIGKNLLPEKFTMTELRMLYETILNEELDRRNFQRKMLRFGILDRLGERRRGGAHKAPYLYSFKAEKYSQSLSEGFNTLW